jgi:phosphatidylglycerophosphate synthase
VVRPDFLPLGVLAYFVLGLAAYGVRCARKGVAHDRELEARASTALLTINARLYFRWVISPLWRLLVATRLGANAVTAVAAVIGVTAAVSVATGRFALGGCLFLLSGILDYMDGRLARFQNSATAAGAAFDSILDRYVDFAMLAGLAWYFRGTWVLAFVLLALLGTSLVPYVRAKGEALKVPISNGLMQRPERLFLISGTVAFSPIVDAVTGFEMNWLAAAGIAVVAVATNFTAVTRFRTLLRALREPLAAPATTTTMAAGANAGGRFAASVVRAPQ